MKRHNAEKNKQLGMPIGTASNRLRKLILFDCVKKLKLDYCFRCSKKIEKVSDLSIEHKENWLHSLNPSNLFFDINNIAFSHLKCNVETQRKKYSKCGTTRSYFKGCRCVDCTKANTEKVRKYRNMGK